MGSLGRESQTILAVLAGVTQRSRKQRITFITVNIDHEVSDLKDQKSSRRKATCHSTSFALTAKTDVM